MSPVNRLPAETIWILTALVIGSLLVLFALLMARKGLFAWTKMGFWAWVGFGLFFVASPLSAVWQGHSTRYATRMALAGGPLRGLWILLVAALGIVCFFVIYLRARPAHLALRLQAKQDRLTLPMILVMTAASAVAFYSLLTFRAGLLETARLSEIQSGRFTGQVIGWEHAAHAFLFVPVLTLLLNGRRLYRGLGWILAGAYIVLSLPNGWSRYSTLSMLLALALAGTYRQRRAWPRLIWIPIVLLAASVLQIRGHVPWSLAAGQQPIGRELRAVVGQLPAEAGSVLAGSDTAMLSAWYLDSYLHDTRIGYDYGLPLANYALTGWVPHRLLAGKYFLIDWLQERRTFTTDPAIESMLVGSKVTLLGSFYRNGGLLAVLIQMALMGFLSRKADGLLRRDGPALLQAVALAWLSVLWMVWASSDTWALTVLGAMTVPAVALWLASPKVARQRVARRPWPVRPLSAAKERHRFVK